MTRLRLPLAVAAVLVSSGLGAVHASASTPAACAGGPAHVVTVHTARQLRHAFAGVTPGTEIRLADGVYPGTFTLQRSGTATRPVLVCGSRKAILDGVTVQKGIVLHAIGLTHVTFRGFSLRHGQKAIVVDGSAGAVIDQVAVHGTGMEGVVIRRQSTNVVLSHSRIWDTGVAAAEFGEAVYIGTANNHWCDTTPCTVDHTDGTRVIDNAIGPQVRAEEVDVKEGTSSGTITGNTFDGRGMTGAYSWVDVKGNSWTITANTGRYSRRDGFSDNCAVVGWGNGNLFAKNVAYVFATGYGFRIGARTVRVRVSTSNVVRDAASGAANVVETSA